jgi:hypothetical protein
VQVSSSCSWSLVAVAWTGTPCLHCMWNARPALLTRVMSSNSGAGCLGASLPPCTGSGATGAGECAGGQ